MLLGGYPKQKPANKNMNKKAPGGNKKNNSRKGRKRQIIIINKKTTTTKKKKRRACRGGQAGAEVHEALGEAVDLERSGELVFGGLKSRTEGAFGILSLSVFSF